MSDTTELAERLGAALGSGYAVERPLGEGGFAVVFLVRDLALKRKLAVKVLSPDMISTRSVLERFRREAETVAQLSHPNIVPLHFIGQQDDLLYLAMQCVEGGSIADRLGAEARLPLDDAVRITGEVASALAHAHKRGVIHRDIKPANVLVDPESGRCLVTDFGIARTDGAENLTATGMMLGTPAYLAPEQVTGEQLDQRVDIYALGVMAFEMIAGRLPFDGATPTAAMMKRLAGPPAPLTSVAAGVPKEISDIVAKCLAADPAQRYQSADEVALALETAPKATGHRATVRAGKGSRIAAAVAGTVALAGVAWWATTRARPTAAANAPATPAGMIAIAGGSYTIGSANGPAWTRPAHVEHVPAFLIGRTEVTVAQYRQYMDSAHVPAPWTGAMPNGALPVTRVPWRDAAAFCARMYPGGRLPSETEWEAAARGSSARPYPYGVQPAPGSANTGSALRSALAPVGSYPSGATPEGVQDMSGNVWEWTSSPLAAYAGGGLPALTLPASDYRVIRGGAYDTADSLATGWMRGYLPAAAPADLLDKTGFRCAVTASDSPKAP